jgi:hypothetical protein
MGLKRTDAWRGALVLLSLALGCSDDPSGPPAGRGSAACHEWQSAYCGLLNRCMAVNAACEQIKAIACRSDDEARRCVSVLNAQDCAAPPAACDVPAIADPAPAQKACNDFGNALCSRSEECQPGSRDACSEQVKGMLTCSKAVGVALSFEQCLTDIGKVTCEATSAPDSCKAVILVLQ